MIPGLFLPEGLRHLTISPVGSSRADLCFHTAISYGPAAWGSDCITKTLWTRQHVYNPD